jgi:aminopeptidase N
LDGAALDAYRRVVAAIALPSVERLGWRGTPADDDRARQLRGIVIALVGSFVGDAAALTRAREIVADPSGVDADVLAASIAVVAHAGTEEDFDEYRRRSDAAGSPQEQLRYLHALGDFPGEDLVMRACELAVSDAVRPQNGPFVLQRALRNRDHGPAAWRFVRENWDGVRARFSPSLVARVVEGITWLVDDASFADIPRFIASHPVPEAVRTIAQHLDRLRVHRAAVTRERDRFAAALLER